MQTTHPALAALVGSRLCHDLISPVGAIQNGLELLSLSGADQSAPEMALIQDSCASAAARIRFFRVAFGLATPGQMMGQREVEGNLRDLCAGGRLTPDWTVKGDLSRTEVQLVYLAWLCCETALPQGGTIRVERDDLGWHLTASGPRIAANAVIWAQLDVPEPQPEMTPDKVQFAMLAVLAPERRVKAHMRHDAARLRLDLRCL